ncbi:hypothetical protein B0H14DRAFT_2616819 [Mycena olivaceomarginata]|nr:hypothetical protein B0H14DRAFT_2616819 [Mycena olivaceomarginata]
MGDDDGRNAADRRKRAKTDRDRSTHGIKFGARARKRKEKKKERQRAETEPELAHRKERKKKKKTLKTEPNDISDGASQALPNERVRRTLHGWSLEVKEVPGWEA